ncbi:MAG: penicillin-binding transpeptidase domain-containing protein [Bacilli bacterium]|nr:penicillin-binding transpeptidase domain-containing protein [Bacilli bacterium]
MKKFLLLFKFTIIIFFIFISVYFIYNRKLLNRYYQERLIFKTKKLVSIDDGLRGNIYDKNGILLVGNKKVYNLAYHYNENEDTFEILEFIQNNFNISEDDFFKKVNNSYKYEDIILKNNLTENEVSLVLNSDVKGLFIKESFERFYPYKDTLKNVLGSVGFIQKENKNYYLKKGYKLYEKVGISGLEREYEEYLKGTNAKYKVNNDNSLTLISHGKKGSDLYLSIDINLVNEINTIIKEELVKAKKHLNTQYLNDAFVIVGNPKTSEVYSLNGQRYLNDNTFTDISLNNINSAFTMGSVVKGATISVGYKYNLIEKGKKILDGCVKLKNKTEKCSFKELGYLDDVSALKMSSNYYQFLIAISLLGKKYTPNMDLNASEKEFNIYRDMLSSYGLGIITGIDLPNEKPGLKGNIISDDLLLNLAIGQYDTYTPIELFNYINTLAMKGKRISPSLVNEIKNNDFIIFKNKHEVVDNVQISNDDFNQIHKGFYEVMNNGTGLGFMNKNLLPAGKTGTSESFIDTDNDGKIDTKTLTLTMAGFFPYDDPKISLIVVCPNTSHNNGKNKDYIYYLTSKISRRITNIFNEQKNSFN